MKKQPKWRLILIMLALLAFPVATSGCGEPEIKGVGAEHGDEHSEDEGDHSEDGESAEGDDHSEGETETDGETNSDANSDTETEPAE